MFPLRDDNPRHGPAIIMWVFVALNVLVFLYENSLSSERQLLRFVETYGFIPREFFSLPLAELFTLLSSMFLHGGLGHILGNMFFLFVFGDNVEDRMGHLRFPIFYLLGGVVATLFHGFFSLTSPTPMVGASGAISAVLGAYIVLFPRQRILTFIPPLFLPWLVFRVFARIPRFFLPWLPAWVYLGYWAILQLAGASSDFLVRSDEMSGVAFWAHVGGFIFGVVTVHFFKKRRIQQVSSTESDNFL
jgi:membrane associated rhomboid family serine protease